MRRLEDLDLKDLVLPTPSFDEIDRFILGPQAANDLVEAVSGVLLARARADVLLDAYRQILFEDASVLSPTEALIRSASIREDAAQANKYARAVLITAVAFGSVTIDETGHGCRFRHVHPGVVHVRSHGNVVDARTAMVVGRGSTLAGLVKRESKRRGRAVGDRRRQLRETISERSSQVDPSTPVHVELRSADHPPAETMGEFIRELPGFIEQMPTWRLGQVAMFLNAMPRKSMHPEGPGEPSPPELDDFGI